MVDWRLLCFTHEGQVSLLVENVVIFQNKSMERVVQLFLDYGCFD